MSDEIITCTPKSLPDPMRIPAAAHAIRQNPLNRPPVERAAHLLSQGASGREFLAIMTSKRWKTNGVRLTVGFMETTPADLRARIVSHMNAWSQSANVAFVETQSNDAQVRILRENTDGYWSYIGTDILLIDQDQPTMNLQGFTMATPDSEFHRVVRHETGHTLGFPHEHMRQDLVALIDPAKAIPFFEATQGWSEDQIRQQVLTPIQQSSLLGTARSDTNSIMCYQIPGSITFSGQPIPGGTDIDQTDFDFAATCYPKPAAPAPPTP
jgi:hypothetical protein